MDLAEIALRTLTDGVGNTHGDDRSPAVSLLDDHVDVGELAEVLPAGRSVLTNDLVNLSVSPDWI